MYVCMYHPTFDPWKPGNTPAYMKRGYNMRSADETQEKHNTAFSEHIHYTTRNFNLHLLPAPFPFYYSIPLFQNLSMPKIYIFEKLLTCGVIRSYEFLSAGFCVFVWFCLVLCFCCFAVRFGFCFLLCNSETDHGFSPCHTAKPGTGTVLSKVIFQRPSVWT